MIPLSEHLLFELDRKYYSDLAVKDGTVPVFLVFGLGIICIAGLEFRYRIFREMSSFTSYGSKEAAIASSYYPLE